MRADLTNVANAVRDFVLPTTFDDLFGQAWDIQTKRFVSQETFIIDYKETIPAKFSDDYGVGILRLALAFHNAYGGLVVFGVTDRKLTIEKGTEEFDVESFNRALSDCSTAQIECLSRLYEVPGQYFRIAVLLIPKRTAVAPAKLTRSIGRYRAQTIWIRDRHECLSAQPRHLPALYGNRDLTLDDREDFSFFPVHRSLPPSPATMKSFVTRGSLMEDLWNWLVIGDRPRLYLHGPGGSGKSTLAFEFAKQLSEHGHVVRFPNGERFDYIVYISGKESELNIHSFKEQPFALRQFKDAGEQFGQILYHSGLLDEDRIASASTKETTAILTELFNTFNGLIVIDDIDALSRRNIDTGEESLLLECVKSAKHNKVLYTLRNAPAYALGSALPVPGLSEDELHEFLEICCKEFDVPLPSGEYIPLLQQEAASLPLLVETVVGIRRFSSNYQQALQTFKDKGGDEARRYLYQREYDRLSQAGKSRYVLATLLLLEDPTSPCDIRNFTQFSTEVVAEALSETSSVFLSAFESTSGETVFQLSPPAIAFVRRVSENLPFINNLKKKVGHLRKEGGKDNPREAALVVALRSLLIQGSPEQAASQIEQYPKDDTVLVNPKINALYGQALAELGPTRREDARAAFRVAESMSFRDIHMMRSWFNLEFNSGYSLPEARRICENCIDDSRFGPRDKTEFFAKLGSCRFQEAIAIGSASKEKAFISLRASIVAYMEALWVGRGVKTIDLNQTAVWCERPLQRLVQMTGYETEEFLQLIEDLADKGHDIEALGVETLLRYMALLPRNNVAAFKSRLKGFCTRTINRVTKQFRPVGASAGFAQLVDALGSIRDWADSKTKAHDA